ncbi:extracellular solute-binding protein [Paenibacillus hemerocallicola]|uniref:Extracellular solute-binding protein n=1 Tax=Paenibacillus hemerocallicola TaxID=1172614 RepID=A0A5C4SXN2_9BACL|nr:extracellular solute-binding protein [Paenibacillus hemerocallicola]
MRRETAGKIAAEAVGEAIGGAVEKVTNAAKEAEPAIVSKKPIAALTFRPAAGLALRGAAVLTAVGFAIALTACGGSPSKDTPKGEAAPTESASTDPSVIDKPVELAYYENSSGYSREMFDKDVGDVVKKKFPNVTFKLYSREKGTMLADLIASGVKLDLISASAGTIADLADTGLGGDIDDLVKKYKYDVSQLEPSAVDMLRKAGDGKLYGLPLKIPASALFYNKDVFDKFGVSYPKDGMTWDELYELAVKLTRNDGGVQYKGFLASFSHIASMNQLSQEFIDPKTGKAALSNDNWKKIFDNLIRFYRIPGNEFDKTTISTPSTPFYKDKTVAMFASVGGQSYSDLLLQLNWDVVGLPTYKERPGVGSGPYPVFLNVANTSAHRDEAFKVLAYLTSKEVQQSYIDNGIVPALKKSAYRNDFGKSNPALKGKNVQSIIPDKFAEPIMLTKYQNTLSSALNAAFSDAASGTKDVASALREADEKANKAIETAKAGGK